MSAPDLLDMLELADVDALMVVIDSSTGERVGVNDRCPSCRQTGFGPCEPSPGQRHQYRTAEGWLTLARCRCGRLRFRRLEPRDWDAFKAVTSWGPIVEPPDVAAWMRGVA